MKNIKEVSVMKKGKYLRGDQKKSDLRFFVSLITSLLLFLVVFQPVKVQGSSMETTLIDGDLLLMERSWLVEHYNPGDIIIAAKPDYKGGESIVKRIIAIEGQVVDINDETGTLYVDGVELTEPYISSVTYKKGDMAFPCVVADDCFFVLGDNRNESLDSRYTVIGQIHISEIQGKVICLVVPGTNDGEFAFEIDRIGSID